MPTLICYDITDNALRSKIGNKLLELGLDRINRSVYLGTMTESALARLETLLQKWIAAKADPNDSLIILPVNDGQIYRMKVIGSNNLDPEDLTGDLHTLIL